MGILISIVDISWEPPVVDKGLSRVDENKCYGSHNHLGKNLHNPKNNQRKLRDKWKCAIYSIIMNSEHWVKAGLEQRWVLENKKDTSICLQKWCWRENFSSQITAQEVKAWTVFLECIIRIGKANMEWKNNGTSYFGMAGLLHGLVSTQLQNLSLDSECEEGRKLPFIIGTEHKDSFHALDFRIIIQHYWSGRAIVQSWWSTCFLCWGKFHVHLLAVPGKRKRNLRQGQRCLVWRPSYAFCGMKINSILSDNCRKEFQFWSWPQHMGEEINIFLHIKISIILSSFGWLCD